MRLLHFLRVQWQCDWKSKIKNQNFSFWAILDLQKLFELSWNLSLIVAIQIISFCSLDYCLEWDLIWIEFEPPSISPHVMEHKKCGGNKKGHSIFFCAVWYKGVYLGLFECHSLEYHAIFLSWYPVIQKRDSPDIKQISIFKTERYITKYFFGIFSFIQHKRTRKFIQWPLLLQSAFASISSILIFNG